MLLLATVVEKIFHRKLYTKNDKNLKGLPLRK